MAPAGYLVACLVLAVASTTYLFTDVTAFSAGMRATLGMPHDFASLSSSAVPAPTCSSSAGRSSADLPARRRRLPSSALSMSPPEGMGVEDGTESIANQDPNLYGKVGDTFVKCGKCQACYPIDVEVLGRGRVIECSVCKNTWFQSVDRALTLTQNFLMKDWSEDRMNEARAKAMEPSRFGFDLFVGNIPMSVSEKDLTAIFGNFGQVVSSSLAKDESDESKGFGVVKMASEADGQKAIGALNGMEIQGRNILVKISASNPASRGGGGRGRGGRSGGGFRDGGNRGYS